MADPDLLAAFKPPWRILRHESGNYHIVDATDRTLCWIYVRGSQATDYKLLEDEEAQMLARRLHACLSPHLLHELVIAVKDEHRPGEGQGLLYLTTLPFEGFAEQGR